MIGYHWRPGLGFRGDVRYNDGSAVPGRRDPSLAHMPVGAWLSLVEHSVRDRGVGGSNPLAPTNFLRYFPVTWVTDYSEHIGNTFGPKGFSIGSSRHASSS